MRHARLMSTLCPAPTASVEPGAEQPRRRQPIRDAQSARTRANLIAAARTLFAANGYHATGVRDITAKAKVTPGALIHHFGDKERLFRAVFDELEHEMLAGADKAANDLERHTFEGFCQGVKFFIDAAAEPTFQRIVLIEAPAVFGWARWRELEEQFNLGTLRQLLREFMDTGVIRRQNEVYLANLIFASIIEAGLLVATADDPATARSEVSGMMIELLSGMLIGTTAA